MDCWFFFSTLLPLSIDFLTHSSRLRTSASLADPETAPELASLKEGNFCFIRSDTDDASIALSLRDLPPSDPWATSGSSDRTQMALVSRSPFVTRLHRISWQQKRRSWRTSPNTSSGPLLYGKATLEQVSALKSFTDDSAALTCVLKTSTFLHVIANHSKPRSLRTGKQAIWQHIWLRVRIRVDSWIQNASSE